MKQFRCGDVVLGCEWVTRSDDEEKLLGQILGTPRHLGVNREHSEPDAVQAVPAPGRRSLSDSGAEARVKRPHVLQACTFPRATPTAPAA